MPDIRSLVTRFDADVSGFDRADFANITGARFAVADIARADVASMVLGSLSPEVMSAAAMSVDTLEVTGEFNAPGAEPDPN
jgi:hypothetical protein